MSQRARTYQVNCCLNVHNAHQKLKTHQFQDKLPDTKERDTLFQYFCSFTRKSNISHI